VADEEGEEKYGTRPGSGEGSSGIRLGNEALKMGWITPEQMREALVEQARNPQAGRTVGLILVAKGFLTGDQLRVLIERERGEDSTKAVPVSVQGTPFGKYLLRREIGQGPHGVVWEALDTVLGRTVAVKILKPRTDVSPEEAAAQEKWFLRESRLLVGLPKHPHVVEVFEVGVQEGQWFLAMEFVEGVVMDRWAENVSPRARILLLREVVLAVQHAHAHGILHLGLKPKNVLVDARSRPHVTDFGLAKNLKGESGASLLANDPAIDCPAYISPERGRDEGAADERADVYSLGVMLYEILTGKVPFTGDTTVEVLSKAARDPVEKPSTTIRGMGLGVDKTLERVCLKALAKKPERRTRSAQDLANGLSRWLDVSEPAPAAPKIRKGLLGKVLGFTVAAAALAGILIGWDSIPWPKGGPPSTVPPAVVLPPDPPPPPPLRVRLPDGFTAVAKNEQNCVEFRCAKDGSIMIAIPEGEFWMGDDDGPPEERPRRRVYTDAFLIDKTEVTVGQFRRFVEATGYITEAEQQGWALVYSRPGQAERKEGATWKSPGFPQTDQHPVTCVSRRDAAAYCAWAGKRLPTEAEWERAARGPEGRMWPWGNTWARERAHADRPSRGTIPAGSLPAGASPFGVLDLAGNVAEVCDDWFDPDYFKKGGLRNPKGPDEGQTRVLKGGSWVDAAILTRSSRRVGVYGPTQGVNNADGFRGVCDLIRDP
jgi:formylglycine-generating enzyme required for sulfatase activity